MSQTRAARRDALAIAFLVLHIAVLVYILIGWALPAGVGFYVVFLPLMVLHWHLNRNACVLNNLETLIRTGHWRDPHNCEEGGWLKTLIRGATGVELTVRQTDLISYVLIAGLWGLGIWHWLGW
jgi:hypothetical protein